MRLDLVQRMQTWHAAACPVHLRQGTRGPHSACHYAGLTALQSLSLVGCCMKTVMPGADWIRALRRASELELRGGTLAAYALDYLLSNGTVGELAMLHML